jgi:hypothetical protein
VTPIQPQTAERGGQQVGAFQIAALIEPRQGRAQVVVLPLHPVQPGRLIWPHSPLVRLLRPLEEMCGVPSLGRPRFSARLQALACVLPQRLQQPVARDLTVRLLCHYQRLVHQPHQQVQRLLAGEILLQGTTDRAGRAHRLRGLQREPALKYRQPLEHRALPLGE